MLSPRPRLALIAGPTASGKSAAAITLAETLNGVVINADASQVYRDLRVLSARPSLDEEARVPHRLFGYVDGAQACSAAAWAADATAQINQVEADGRLPVLVGGTGLYIRTLLDGIAPVPPIDPGVRATVRAMPVAEARARLALVDPPAAARLAPADTSRVARALEVMLSTGRRLADWQAEKAGGLADRVALAPLILLPDRAWLIQRCDERLSGMFAQGAIEEVEALLARPDIPEDAPVRRAIGVPEIADYLRGRLSLDAALTAAKFATHRYAKRQYTWFRNQPPPEWPRIESFAGEQIGEIKHRFG